MSEQISTAAELDALPAESVVRGPDGRIFVKTRFNDWLMAGRRGPLDVSGIESNLPDLTVLYRPDQPEGVAKPLISANSRSVALDPVAATPSGLPSAEQVARALFATDHPDADQHILDLIWRELSTDARARYDKKARAVLALFEAAVPSIKAKALRDEYHTMDELYEYRMLYNALAANWLPQEWVNKSWRHSDGEECFGGGWFVVYAVLPTGQVSNHYKAEHWGLFNIPEVERAPEHDGHTPQVAAQRLAAYLNAMTGAKP